MRAPPFTLRFVEVSRSALNATNIEVALLEIFLGPDLSHRAACGASGRCASLCGLEAAPLRVVDRSWAAPLA